MARMDEDIEMVYSPLQQRCTRGGHTVEICIYKMLEDTLWQLEVVDAGGTSTVWDDGFTSEKDALEEAIRTIDEDGIEGFLTEMLPSKTH